MNRLLAIAVASIVFLVLPAWAQSTTSSDLASQSPQTNARSGSVRQRAPGTWVQSAIARHKGFIGQRVNAPRSGQSGSQNQASSSSNGSTTTSSNSVAGLSTLANQFLSGLSSLGGLGNLANLGDLGSLLSTLTGSTTSTSTTASNTSTTASSSNASNYTINDLLALRDAMAAQQGTAKSLAGQQQSSTDPNTAITTTTEPKFKDRLMQAWATTFFSALTLGFQTTSFITTVKDALRPLILPTSQATSQPTSQPSTSTGATNTTGTNGSGSGTGTSGGIQSIPTSSSGTGSSTI